MLNTGESEMKTLFVLLFLIGSVNAFSATSEADVAELTGMKEHSMTGGEICNSEEGKEDSSKGSQGNGDSSAVKN